MPRRPPAVPYQAAVPTEYLYPPDSPPPADAQVRREPTVPCEPPAARLEADIARRLEALRRQVAGTEISMGRRQAEPQAEPLSTTPHSLPSCSRTAPPPHSMPSCSRAAPPSHSVPSSPRAAPPPHPFPSCSETAPPPPPPLPPCGPATAYWDTPLVPPPPPPPVYDYRYAQPQLPGPAPSRWGQQLPRLAQYDGTWDYAEHRVQARDMLQAYDAEVARSALVQCLTGAARSYLTTLTPEQRGSYAALDEALMQAFGRHQTPHALAASLRACVQGPNESARAYSLRLQAAGRRGLRDASLRRDALRQRFTSIQEVTQWAEATELHADLPEPAQPRRVRAAELEDAPRTGLSVATPDMLRRLDAMAEAVNQLSASRASLTADHPVYATTCLIDTGAVISLIRKGHLPGPPAPLSRLRIRSVTGDVAALGGPLDLSVNWNGLIYKWQFYEADIAEECIVGSDMMGGPQFSIAPGATVSVRALLRGDDVLPVYEKLAPEPLGGPRSRRDQEPSLGDDDGIPSQGDDDVDKPLSSGGVHWPGASSVEMISLALPSGLAGMWSSSPHEKVPLITSATTAPLLQAVPRNTVLAEVSLLHPDEIPSPSSRRPFPTRSAECLGNPYSTDATMAASTDQAPTSAEPRPPRRVLPPDAPLPPDLQRLVDGCEDISDSQRQEVNAVLREFSDVFAEGDEIGLCTWEQFRIDTDCKACTRLETQDTKRAAAAATSVCRTQLLAAPAWLPDEMRADQLADPTIRPILEACERGQRPPADEAVAYGSEARTLWLQWDSLFVKNGVLHRRWRHPSGDPGRDREQLVLPANRVPEVVREYHALPVAVESTARAEAGLPGPMRVFNDNTFLGRWTIDIAGPYPAPTACPRYAEAARVHKKWYCLVCVESFTNWPEVLEEQRDWPSWIPLILLAYRTAPHSATRVSPAEMLYGRMLSLPADLAREPPPAAHLPFNESEYPRWLRETMRRIHADARVMREATSQKYKVNYDLSTALFPGKPGDAVWLYRPVRKPGRNPKLAPKWEGPYVILERVNDLIVWLQSRTNGKKRMANVQNIAPYVDPDFPVRGSWLTFL
ncbi:Retrovirus-related Pol polyprotein from transposon 412 [Frankliniella fusca]|uniref:Retrovirus-related Pol polyprotein from transposon 412 n=1 Tax=Frankliniella fusca TaxID=407009 RepID=A0AAE1HFI5_9NEOP|nr:Retrovirus-related Pol polyprotein from transposon 412 [Frankliniella fusca]